MMPNAKALTRLAIVLAALLAVILLVACAPELPAPAASVQELLEIRADRSQDASAYAEYVVSPELAEELALAAIEESASPDPPTPNWSAPYVSTETSSTANVVVVWDADDRFEEWPVATIFKAELVDGRWVTVDAEIVESEDEIPERPE